MSTKKIVNIGLIGGGLMGRELASALARWFVLVDPPVEARLIAVADLSEPAREWFRRIPTVTQVTASAEETGVMQTVRFSLDWASLHR